MPARRPSVRLATLRGEALERLDAATVVLAALHAEAAEEERPCERGAAPFVVVFEGAYVKARSRPSLASPVTRTLRRSQRFVAYAGGVFVYELL